MYSFAPSDSATSSSQSSPQKDCLPGSPDSGHDSVTKTTILRVEACLVCGVASHGLHFQVATCRACAAFFRRSVKAKRVYKCRRGNRNCDLNPTSKPLCRFCRLQQCYKVGMRYETSTLIDESTAQKSDFSESEDDDETLAKPRIVNGNHLVFDSERIIRNVKQILKPSQRQKSWSAPNGVYSSPCQQLQVAFAKLRKELCPPGLIEPASVYDKLAVMEFVIKYSIKVAQMLMEMDCFAELCFDDKFKLFRRAWPLIHMLEREFSSCEMFGHNLDDYRVLLTDTLAVDGTRTLPYFEGVSPIKAKELADFCIPLKEHKFACVSTPFKQLQPTQFEVCYMIGLIVFNAEEVRKLEPRTKIVCEQMIDQFSSELHNYYNYELRMSNYASRMARIMRLISSLQQQVSSLKDHMTMAKIFDIFVTDIFDTELYE